MERRTFITLLGGGILAAPLTVEGQPVGKIHRVGVLWPGASPPPGSRMEWFRQGLRESGYVEGQNVAIDLRYAEAGARLRELTGELAQLNVSVIATFGDLAPKMGQQATTAIPIVATMDDFVGTGLVPNLARPGGNITGVSLLSPELSAKRLELLKTDPPQDVPGGHPLGPRWPIPVEGDGGCSAVAGSEAPSPGGARSGRPCRGFPSREEGAGGSPQCLGFPASFFFTPSNHRPRGGKPASGNLPVEGTRGDRGPGVLRA